MTVSVFFTFHHVLLFKKGIYLFSVVLYVKHKVEHKLAEGQFHISGIAVEISLLCRIDFCKMSQPIVFWQAKIHLFRLHIAHEVWRVARHQYLRV